MRQHVFVKLGVPLLAGALALSACGTRSEETGASGEGAEKVAKIGVIAPFTGNISDLGTGIRNSVDLAIKQANDKKTIPGWKLELAAEDDTAKPEVGSQVATKLTSDKQVVAVVGTLNSNVAQSVQPILAQANVLMVSPANTNPTLTQGNNWQTSRSRQFENYFRTSTTDAIQGPFAADYLAKDAGIKSVVVVHDKKTYGQGLAESFTAQFTKDGGTVLGSDTVNPGDKDFSAVISKIQQWKPDAVYYGGEHPEASLLTSQMKAKGLNVPLMGGDGIYSPTYIANGGPAANGDIATSVGAPTEKLASAKAFVEAYGQNGYKEPYAAYGAYSFDATNVIIEALKVSLKDASEINDDVREKTIKATQGISFDGVTGKVAFDEYGDTTSKVLTVYKVEGGTWEPVKTDEFK